MFWCSIHTKLIGNYQGWENRSKNEEEVHPEAITRLVHTDYYCFSHDQKNNKSSNGHIKEQVQWDFNQAMMSLRRLEVTRCNIWGENLHIEIERSQGPKPVGTLHLSRGGKTCQTERGNRKYRDKRPKGNTDRGKNDLDIWRICWSLKC